MSWDSFRSKLSLSDSVKSKLARQCEQFEQEWKAGQCPSLESYVSEATGDFRKALLGELIRLDFRYRQLRAEEVSVEEYRDRFSEVPDVVDAIFALDQTLTAAKSDKVAPLTEKEPWRECQPGDLIADRFRIVSRIGEGGMGTVYLAEDTELDNLSVALKLLKQRFSQDQQLIGYLKSEVRIGRNVSHKHVCKIHDLYTFKGTYFLSMEFIEGEDLGSLLKKVGRFTPEKTLQLARQLCDGVSAIHEHEVVHRDLKPSNVMIDSKGNVRITDFGLALSHERDAQPKDNAGTPAYAAPEQLARGEITKKSDLYSLGLILYEVYTGHRVFSANTLSELEQVRQRPIPLPSEVAPNISRFVDQTLSHCLQEDPDKRPDDAKSVAKGLVDDFPSPEELSKQGGRGTLSPQKAFLCFAGVFLGLLFVFSYADRATLFGQAQPEDPEVLRSQAETILEHLGYDDPQHRVDVAYGFVHNKEQLSSNPQPTQRSGTLAPILYWYRQSSKHFVPNDFFPEDYTWWHGFRWGRVSTNNPPTHQPGMVTLKFDPRGALLEFIAVPENGVRRKQADSANEQKRIPEEQWRRWFQSVFDKNDSLTWETLEGSPLQSTPLIPFDRTIVWLGKDREGNTRLRLEAAAFRGRPTFFELIEPSPEGNQRDPFEFRNRRQLSYRVQLICYAGFLLVGMLIAGRNWSLGRGDISGAWKIALWMFCWMFLVGSLWMSHLPTLNELDLWELNLGMSLYFAFVTSIYYLALEPYIRKDLPQTLISWNRLMLGRFRDPRVGRDILAGVLGGTFAVGLKTINYLVDDYPMQGGLFDSTLSFRVLLAVVLDLLAWSVRMTFFFLLFYWSFWAAVAYVYPIDPNRLPGSANTMAERETDSRWFNRKRIPHLLAILLLTLMTLHWTSGTVFGIVRLVFVFALYFYVLDRFGFLASIAWGSVSMLLDLPIASDPNRWYFDSGLCVFALIVGLAWYGCYVSMGTGIVADKAASS